MKNFDVLLDLNTSKPDINEILRYLFCKTASDDIVELINSCLIEAKDKISFSVIYKIFDIKISENIVDLGFTSTESCDLCKNLSGCNKVILFAASLGREFDMLLTRYNHISSVKAAIFQAIGAERIEALCDAFCSYAKETLITKGYTLRPRFSCGYGDLTITIQKEILSALDATRKIGITLTDNYLMLPTKSVTAFVGLYKNEVI